MVQLLPGMTAAPVARRPNALGDLTVLLSRLQRTILHADAEREARLRASEFEREKALANIRYARSLLTKLEQEALALKVHARRQEVQADLVRKRELLDQLSERLSDLDEIAAAARDVDTGEDTSDGEDILADIIATPSESVDSSRSPDIPPKELEERRTDQSPDSVEQPPPPPFLPPRADEDGTSLPEHPEQPEQPPESAAPHPTTTTTTTTTTQTLRIRRGEPTPAPPTTEPEPQATASATTTGAATHPTPAPTAATSALFGHRSPSSLSAPTAAAAAISTQEAILDHQRAEQDALSESILRLAAELKASSRALGASLEEDRELVDRAGRGLARAGEHMEGAARRVGMLRRMTEAEGFWGRLRLYALVYGLMVLLCVVVFVLPKLRF